MNTKGRVFCSKLKDVPAGQVISFVDADTGFSGLYLVTDGPKNVLAKLSTGELHIGFVYREELVAVYEDATVVAYWHD